MPRVLFLTAGPIATSGELVNIAKIEQQLAVRGTLECANGLEVIAEEAKPNTFYNYVAGTLVAPYNSGYTVYDPDAPPTLGLLATQGIVNDGDTFDGGGGNTVTVTVEDNEVTMVVS